MASHWQDLCVNSGCRNHHRVAPPVEVHRYGLSFNTIYREEIAQNVSREVSASVLGQATARGWLGEEEYSK